MKAAVLSDTHNLFRPEVREIIKECDAVIHAGDICSENTLSELKDAMKPEAPLFIVRGNCDSALSEKLPSRLEFQLSGINFFLVHNKKDIPENIKADIIIFGHSHKYSEKKLETGLYLNPGSCGPKRFSLPVTMAEIDMNGYEYKIKRLEFKSEAAENFSQKDLLKSIQLIMKYTEKGLGVETISKKLKLSPGFTEQVVRIILTHPGVTTDQIINKYASLKGSVSE